ncbi:MAG: hypothetical protein KDA25_12600 [Phycisphaerales bacterium]|nr:hypothetical protein [Phycisphaerales bacterium]
MTGLLLMGAALLVGGCAPRATWRPASAAARASLVLPAGERAGTLDDWAVSGQNDARLGAFTPAYRATGIVVTELVDRQSISGSNRSHGSLRSTTRTYQSNW